MNLRHKKHRNSQKRIIFEDAVYFVTSKTFDNYPYFREPIFCDLFIENLCLCKRLKKFFLFGWVLNYDHFHMQIQPNDEFNISEVMQFLKRHISRNLNIIMEFGEQLSTHSEGGIGQCRLQGSESDYVQRKTLVQKLHQFDILVRILKSRFKLKYPSGHPFPKFQWQESFHDHYIRNDWDFDDKLEYIVYNPDKHGLPPDWPYVFTNPKYENLIDNFL